jgi:hypothetical protein
MVRLCCIKGLCSLYSPRTRRTVHFNFSTEVFNIHVNCPNFSIKNKKKYAVLNISKNSDDGELQLCMLIF